MLKTVTIAAIALASFAVPATAASFDAFSSFDGTQGAGGFTYGSFASSTGTFTTFTATSGCTGLISDTICLNDGFLPAAFKTTAGAHGFGSVNVPDDRLILHPGNSDDAAYVEFTASVAGLYTLASEFSVQDTSPSGVDISFFLRVGGVLQFIDPIGSLSSPGQSFTYFNGGPLAVGDSVGMIVDKQGVYFNDSTGVNLTLTQFTPGVPEPASWALLIAGFGLSGAALRRRRQVALAA